MKDLILASAFLRAQGAGVKLKIFHLKFPSLVSNLALCGYVTSTTTHCFLKNKHPYYHRVLMRLMRQIMKDAWHGAQGMWLSVTMSVLSAPQCALVLIVMSQQGTFLCPQSSLLPQRLAEWLCPWIQKWKWLSPCCSVLPHRILWERNNFLFYSWRIEAQKVRYLLSKRLSL